jgi:hypothetical protein
MNKILVDIPPAILKALYFSSLKQGLYRLVQLPAPRRAGQVSRYSNSVID